MSSISEPKDRVDMKAVDVKATDEKTTDETTTETDEKSAMGQLAPVHTTDRGFAQEAKVDAAGIVLSTTPTSDPLDPQNWSKVQKSAILAIVCTFYFLFTYQTTAPNPAFTQLQEQFNATYTQVNWTFAIPSLGLAVGPLFSTALADIFGRRIVMIAGTVIALVASGCTGIKGLGFSGYMAARFFQGFGASPAATVGLGIINDMSHEHERGFHIGLWVMAIDLGGYFGGFRRSPFHMTCVHVPGNG